MNERLFLASKIEKKTTTKPTQIITIQQLKNITNLNIKT